MTPGRPGSDHGRGGQGGREPRATVQARALRVLDRSVAGLSQREIAAEEGLSQSAVSKILQRLEARVLEELVGAGRAAKSTPDAVLRPSLSREPSRRGRRARLMRRAACRKKTQPGVGSSQRDGGPVRC